MSRKISELDPLTTVLANDDTRLLPIGDASTGRLYKITLSQAKEIFQTYFHKYTATGSEASGGTVITVGALLNKTILSIARESGMIFKVDSSPDPAEYTWDLTDITLGTATTAGERFLIQYKST
jgi:hypothetical protein